MMLGVVPSVRQPGGYVELYFRRDLSRSAIEVRSVSLIAENGLAGSFEILVSQKIIACEQSIGNVPDGAEKVSVEEL